MIHAITILALVIQHVQSNNNSFKDIDGGSLYLLAALYCTQCTLYTMCTVYLYAVEYTACVCDVVRSVQCTLHTIHYTL